MSSLFEYETYQQVMVQAQIQPLTYPYNIICCRSQRYLLGLNGHLMSTCETLLCIVVMKSLIVESNDVKQRVTNWLLAIVVYVSVFFYYSNNQLLKTLWFVYLVSLWFVGKALMMNPSVQINSCGEKALQRSICVTKKVLPLCLRWAFCPFYLIYQDKKKWFKNNL